MSEVRDSAIDQNFDQLVEKRPFGERLMSLIRRQPLGATGAATIIFLVLCAVFADFISFYDPENANFDHMFIAPGSEYILGTDQFGRDIWSRLAYGARTALLVGVTAGFLGATIGLILGVTSAYYGGWFDLCVQRVIDVMLAFPLVILALAIVAMLGTGLQNVILAIVIVKISLCARVVRSNALAIREIPYVDAARAMAFSDSRIVLRHMVPNVMAPYLIILTFYIGDAILLEASLSYLGLGLQEPTPSWGLMLQGGAEEFAESAPWLAIWPGVAISLAVFGFNIFGDALRDLLDPKLRMR
ncbi:MAG: ABC transporter permease [Rhodospirillales bacterium]|nr:ABC transporter permease [Rhodospirillales bacterium]